MAEGIPRKDDCAAENIIGGHCVALLRHVRFCQLQSPKKLSGGLLSQLFAVMATIHFVPHRSCVQSDSVTSSSTNRSLIIADQSSVMDCSRRSCFRSN